MTELTVVRRSFFEELKMKADSQRKIQQAQIAYANGNIKKTISILEPICEDPVSIQVNSLYVQALMKAKQYQRAYREALNHELQYLKNKKLFNIWVEVLLANDLFIPARLSVVNYEKVFGQSKVAEYLREIKQKELVTQEEQANTIKENLKNFYHIGDQPAWSQQQILQNADHLPLEQYVQGAQFILRDPFTKALIRATILNTLLDLNYGKTIRFIWIDNKEHEIIPNQMDEKSRECKIDQLQQILKKRFANNNPIDYENYSQQLKIQLLLLTPYESLVIKDSAVWIDVLTNRDSSDKEKELKVAEAQEWQHKIQNLLVENP